MGGRIEILVCATGHRPQSGTLPCLHLALTLQLASSIQSYICTCEQIEYTNDKKNHGQDFQRLGQAFWGLCKGLCQAVKGLIMFRYAGS